jgi:hypothetical protein
MLRLEVRRRLYDCVSARAVTDATIRRPKTASGSQLPSLHSGASHSIGGHKHEPEGNSLVSLFSLRSRRSRTHLVSEGLRSLAKETRCAVNEPRSCAMATASSVAGVRGRHRELTLLISRCGSCYGHIPFVRTPKSQQTLTWIAILWGNTKELSHGPLKRGAGTGSLGRSRARIPKYPANHKTPC